MKHSIYLKAALMLAAAGGMVSCNDYLDKEPTSEVTPEKYFNTEAALEGYANGRYTEVLPSHGNWSYGIYGDDVNTDVMVSQNFDGMYLPGDWKTSLTDGNYSFSNINTINYFFDQVLPKYEEGTITGSKSKIDRYIGEMYFFRAFEYFRMLKRFGDFPIVTTSLPDDLATLTEASKRSPRNEVARFILSDLDKAYDLLKGDNAATTRINANTVQLIKSRVALYEGTWLKNFAGTAFVPGTSEWPGKDKDYNASFAYTAGSAEAESNWFLEQAMAAAKAVGDDMVGKLTANTGIVPQEEGKTLAEYDAMNPWLAMFGTLSLNNYPEVLLWREYNRGFGIVHNVVVMAQKGDNARGTTRGMVDRFVMKNGLPIYAAGSGYKGDQTIADVRIDRDPRLFVLLKEPGQKNVLIAGNGDHANPVEGYPGILQSNVEENYSTGYALRKGNCVDQAQAGNGNNYTACPVFLGVEALLNYIEASYERNGNIDATADRYWKAIRGRHAGLETDYTKTINATVMSEEAKNDWGAYTAGVLVDPVRYNIRRERSCELIAHGFRMDDLKRWRAMDQMVTTGYHIEGIHIWNTPMESWYDAAQLAGAISSRTISEYLRPFESVASSPVIGGLKWTMAHYLRPLPIKEMMLTSTDGATVADSPLYQNPYWPSEPNLAATK